MPKYLLYKYTGFVHLKPTEWYDKMLDQCQDIDAVLMATYDSLAVALQTLQQYSSHAVYHQPYTILTVYAVEVANVPADAIDTLEEIDGAAELLGDVYLAPYAELTNN